MSTLPAKLKFFLIDILEQRVIRELHILAKIKHDNVIGLFLIAFDQEDDTVTLISRSYGGNLKQYLSNSVCIDYPSIVSYIH